MATTRIAPYLMFDGNCHEAMDFYHDCLGGELTVQTVGESPMADKSNPDGDKRVMHAMLATDTMTLLASDMMGAEKGIQGNTIALTLICSTEEEINRFFTKLSAGGEVVQPLAEAFWGALFGMLTDKYGFRWMLNFDKPKA